MTTTTLLADHAVREEATRLDAIATRSLYGTDVYRYTLDRCFRIFERHLRPGSILELGPAEGHMTHHLASLGRPLALVEGSAQFCRDLAAAFPEAEVTHALFEEYEPRRQVANIVLGHVLEHVVDPAALLSRIRDWLEPGGRLLVAVPNARSLHRQAGVVMRMLPFEEALNDLDRHHGHRRVYNPESFRRDVAGAGFEIENFGGYGIKLCSNAQMADFPPALLDALTIVGERYPDIASDLYIVAGVRA